MILERSYLVDSIVLARVPVDVRRCRAFSETCRLPSEALREAQGSRTSQS